MGRGTAAVLILGHICARNCKFCSVAAGKPLPPDKTEPQRIAEMAQKLNLKYLVLTSVNRDDLPDGGASHFRDCINTIRENLPDIKIEILVPDFKNCQEQAVEILAAEILSRREPFDFAQGRLRGHRGFVFAHNIETVPSLYSKVRTGGNYELSLNLLSLAKERLFETPIKSSIMLGLGETDDEIQQVLKDLRSAGCERITIGQYLKPSKDSFEVAEYIRPEKFDLWKQKALEAGFSWVISEPFARSSYFAEIETSI